ncbi:MAG: energy transducer TonB [Gammaproteobacteria bacterium]|nr:energy transducer TonB [Gammaproteobacteria bacterium]MDH3767174.1 energy transducer TonB [Gammaproteobacteria bacterium]
MSFATAENIANDRLVSTLFLATLFHGILILGVSFNVGIFPESKVDPTLEVVLVQSASPMAQTNKEARYLALENSLGSGNTTDRITPASRSAEPAPADSVGKPDASTPDSSQPGQSDPTLELIVSKSLSSFSIVSLRKADSGPEEAVLMQAAPESDVHLSDIYDETRSRDLDPREKIVSVSTRESDIAGYLAGWKRKIEQVGTLNFPALREIGSQGRNPVLEVAVRSDGHLHDIIVRRSSQVRIVDEAAVQILRMSSPFDPFPIDLQNKYDMLRFVYEWQFIDAPASQAKPKPDSDV